MMNKFSIITDQNVGIENEISSVPKRIFAFVLDSVFLLLFVFIFSLFLWSTIWTDDRLALILSLGSSIFFFFYSFIFELLAKGQTPGKMLLDIRVVSVYGQKAKPGQYFVRALLKPIDMINGLGLIIMFINKKNQRLGDVLASTIIVDVPKKIHLHQLSHQNLPADYEPKFSKTEVNRLNDEQIQLIKEVLTNAGKKSYYITTQKLYKRVLEITQIDPGSHIPLQLLKDVLNDYTHFNR